MRRRLDGPVQLGAELVDGDGSFVSGLGSRNEDAAIVTAVLTLARALGLSAIAEGVEQSSQRDELIRLGCGAAQGFLFSPPRPAEELVPA